MNKYFLNTETKKHREKIMEMVFYYQLKINMERE